MNLVKINTSDTVNARELYSELTKNKKKKTPFTMWIGRNIKKYGFENNKDFLTILLESTGGRKKKEFHITYTMAKELCMLDDTEVGRNIRRKYINLENECRNKYIKRLALIETRKSLTDKVKDSGENDRMHGFAYSNYTILVYKLCKLDDAFKLWKSSESDIPFRDTITQEDIKRVDTVEKLVDAYLSMGKQYNEIKESLSKIVTFKKIGDNNV